MRNLVFLHSTGDLKHLQILVSLAEADCEETGLRPWIDAPDTRDRTVGTVSSGQEVGQQIAEAIRTAGAIVYCVGSTGLGPYQERVESGLVHQAVMDRAQSDDPIRFVPVLLNDGFESEIPDWARAYTIVNLGRTERHPVRLWELIKQRLRDKIEPLRAAPERANKGNDLIQRLIGPITERPVLTVFVGPYALDAHGESTIGPAAITRSLLNQIGMGGVSEEAMPPWPSDVAEWLALTGSRIELHRGMRKLLAPLGHNPPELAHSIGYLAQSWIRRWGERTECKQDWQGLLLLTTRVDLALESALARQANVNFTRILPTLNLAESSADLRRLVQQWSSDPNWTPDLSAAGLESAPCEDLAAAKQGQLPNFPLDRARRVILVKLCGTLEIPESLRLTAYEFFGNSGHFDSLPRGINEAIATSPHLFLGRGLASPLAQLIRHKLIDRHRTKQPRLVLLPSETPDGALSDPLCDLDLALLGRDEQTVIASLNASAIHRGPEHVFVRRLAEQL